MTYKPNDQVRLNTDTCREHHLPYAPHTGAVIQSASKLLGRLMLSAMGNDILMVKFGNDTLLVDEAELLPLEEEAQLICIWCGVGNGDDYGDGTIAEVAKRECSLVLCQECCNEHLDHDPAVGIYRCTACYEEELVSSASLAADLRKDK